MKMRTKKRPDGTVRKYRVRTRQYIPQKEREYDLQVAVAQWLDMNGFVWAHVPNEGKRAMATAMKLKKAGLKAGVPDVLIFGRGTTLCHIAIELKTQHGVVSTTQKAYMSAMQACGWACAVLRDLGSVCDYITQQYIKQTNVPLRSNYAPM